MSHTLSHLDTQTLLETLKHRFVQHMHRHIWLDWEAIEIKLTTQTDKLWSLQQMEQTGGEPDVIWYNKDSSQYVFCDCAAESPAGRRSLCYDRAALDARKQNKPTGNVLDTAAAMGIELLTEEQYRSLQQLEKLDTKTSSRILTPPAIRQHGGALFCDRRYEHVFTYHNGADSYYAARGFRGMLLV